MNDPFILRTDASTVGIAACLMQEHDGIIHPVMYASRKLLAREQKYAIIELEALAVVWGVEKFSKYLEGQTFKIQTDHKPLKCIKVKKCSNKRLQRWALAISQYSFEIEYIPGKDNVCADILSRL